MTCNTEYMLILLGSGYGMMYCLLPGWHQGTKHNKYVKKVFRVKNQSNLALAIGSNDGGILEEMFAISSYDM